ncbi:MAG TPA: hypothetical protein VFS09_13040 [Candidatus Eisenbacteria bacterium]|nr:hypothetical protein [Candidatus Eisenbacteria bacterium]
MKTITSAWARLVRAAGLIASLLGIPAAARATVYDATPANYQSLLGSLLPGDTLRLGAGNYPRLTIDGLNGTSAASITIAGPASGAPAVILGDPCCNTVQLYGSSYVAIKNLTIDGQGYDVDGINAKGTPSHHILIEGCTFLNFANNQQTVAISTKVETWNWIVRGNYIDGAGTGMYFGNSDGCCPFVAGIIENNLVKNTTGYNVQVKHQNVYTLLPGMPAGPNRTIIRNNVFIKDDRPSPDGSRPNLLVDGFPDSGPGSTDLYEIYGNLIVHNPRESLIQASGRVSIHDNVLVDAGADQNAIFLTDHNHVLKLAHVYNNTIYGGMQGIRFANQPREEGRVVGNMVFADTPISSCCTLAANSGNVTDTIANAGSYVNQPTFTLGSMDFYPRSSCATCSGAALDLSAFSTQTDYDRDFNATSKGGFTYRGAYAGAGVNPGWRLSDGFKSSGATGVDDVVAPAAISDLRPR